MGNVKDLCQKYMQVPVICYNNEHNIYQVKLSVYQGWLAPHDLLKLQR